MKKFLIGVLFGFVLLLSQTADAATKIYGFTALSGSGTGALGAIDGAALADKDMAVGVVSGTSYIYYLNATSGAAEVSPGVIAPATNAGTKRWVLGKEMAQAKVRYVEEYGCKDDSGTTDNTVCIQAALTAGGTVMLTAPNGGYYKITDTLTVSVANTKIKSDSLANIVQATANKGVFAVTVSGVEIDGLELQGPWSLGDAHTTGGNAVYAYGADTSHRLTSFTVKNCTIHGFSYTCIITEYVDNFIAEWNYVHTVPYLGIKSWYGDYQKITKNYVEHVKKAVWGTLAVGIAIGGKDTDAEIPKHANISDNYVYDCGYEGILFEPAWYSIIKGNTVVDCYLGIVDGQWNDGSSFYGRGKGNVVSDNVVVNATLTGADVKSGILGGGPDASNPAYGSVFSNNIIINHGNYDTVHYGALDLRYYSGAAITGNSIYSSRHVALKLQGVTNSSVTANPIYGLATATDAYDARLGGIYLLGGNNYTHVFGNPIYTDDTAAIAVGASDPLCYVGENPYTTTAASPIGSAISANMKRYVDYTAKTASDASGGVTEDLNSRVIAQGSMPVKSSIRFEAAGTKAGTAGNKTINIVWGTQTYPFHAAANTTTDWRISGTIVFSATNAQQITWTLIDGNGSTAAATSGSLVAGKRYVIEEFVAGDDFSNVAATNSTGSSFIATGTTPTTWTNSSKVREVAVITNGYESATEDGAAGDITLKLTGTTAAANDSIVQRIWIVEKSF